MRFEHTGRHSGKQCHWMFSFKIFLCFINDLSSSSNVIYFWSIDCNCVFLWCIIVLRIYNFACWNSKSECKDRDVFETIIIATLLIYVKEGWGKETSKLFWRNCRVSSFIDCDLIVAHPESSGRLTVARRGCCHPKVELPWDMNCSTAMNFSFM